MTKVLLLPAHLESLSAQELGEWQASIAAQRTQHLYAAVPTLHLVAPAGATMTALAACIDAAQPAVLHVVQTEKSAPEPAPKWLPHYVLRTHGVVLDRCWDLRLKDKIVGAVEWVVGTHAELSDPMAALFVQTFYAHLGRGQGVEDAFRAARSTLAEQGVDEALCGELSRSTARRLLNLVFRGTPPPAPNAVPDFIEPPGRWQSAPVTRGPAPHAPPGRHLNAGFYRDQAAVPLTEPLLLGETSYFLAVNIGAPWGPGRTGASIPEQLLLDRYDRSGALALDVVARSPDLGVAPSMHKLRLPRSGDSPMVFFRLHLARAGRQSICVDLLYQGHLLQSRHVEVTVVASDAQVHGGPPVQDGYLTFTRTSELSEAPLAALRDLPRQLTIVAERDPQTATIGLRFYDQSRAQLAHQDSQLSDASLTKILQVLRKQLATIMGAYSGGVRGTPQELAKHLGALADLGRRFYRALLPGLPATADTSAQPGDDAALQVALEPGCVIQVAPLSGQLSVPWELLYERPIETYREGRIRLCQSFQTHGSATTDCPHHGDPQVVCPHGFWGYRYILEQLPCRVDPSAPSGITLPLTLDNRAPLLMLAVINSKLARASSHVAALRGLPGVSLVPVGDLSNLQSELVHPRQAADIVYFYTHGGCDEFGSPYLELGPGSRLLPNDLDAWQVQLPHRPLVVMNACDSANYSPERFDDLIQLLCRCGAAGVLGTQCEVREILAGDLMMRFLGKFLHQVPAGQALLQTRLALLAEHDPRGLAYSLFAAAEVRLAHPVV